MNTIGKILALIGALVAVPLVLFIVVMLVAGPSSDTKSPTPTAAADAPYNIGPPLGLEIKVLRWSQARPGRLRVQMSVRNDSTIDYAVIIWKCDFRDNGGALIGRGVPIVFADVPANTATLDTQTIETNGIGFSQMKCSIDNLEHRTADNGRLYQVSPQHLSLPKDDPRGGWATPPQRGNDNDMPL